MSRLEEEIAKLLHDNWALTGDLAVEKVLFSTGPLDRSRFTPQVVVSEGTWYLDEYSMGPTKRTKAYIEVNVGLYAWRPRDAAGMIKAKGEKDDMLKEALRILRASRQSLTNAKFLLFTDPAVGGVQRPRVVRADDFSDKPPLIGYQLIFLAVKDL